MSLRHLSPIPGAWRLGLCGLASLAMFFALVALWRPAPARFVVQAIVGADLPDDVAADAARLRQELTSDDAWLAAVRGAGYPADDTDIAKLHAALTVYRAPGGSANQSRWAIETSGAAEEVAVAIVDRLTQHFLQAHGSAATPAAREIPELASARQAVSDASAEEDAARREVDRLVREQLELTRDLADAARPALPEPAPEPVPQQPVESPEARRLRDQIQRLNAKREELLGRLTEEHPLVQDVSGELADLQARYQRLPKENTDVTPAAQTSAAPPAGDDRAARARAALAALQVRLKAAQTAYDTARGKRLEAQAAVEVWSRAPEALPSAAEPVWRLVRSAQVVDQADAVSPLTRWLTIALASGATLALAAWFTRSPGAIPQFLRTPADMELGLEVPVVAQLSR